MFYTVYRIVDHRGREYIGKHQTKDLYDNYMGSGKHLKRAIEKYGIKNFRKEILYVYETEEEMNAKEAELVTEEYCARDDTYNICPGGQGGWGYINTNNLSRRFSDYNGSDEHRKNSAKGGRKTIVKNRKEAIMEGKIRFDTFTGRNHTDETRKKMSGPRKKSAGCNNSQYGTIWITDGVASRKISAFQKIPDGWKRGRKTKKVTDSG